jgi:hypothetical protein
MPTPSVIAKCIEQSVMKKVDALVDAKLQEFLRQMMEPPIQETTEVEIPVQETEEEGESTRTSWTDEDRRQTAICFVEGISAKVAHKLFPHLKEGSIGCKYREYQWILTNGEKGFCGNESSRATTRDTLKRIGAI